MQEVELYEFSSGAQEFHLTPHEVTVALGGHTYQPCQIERNALALGAEAAKAALDLKLPPDHALVRHLLQAATRGEVNSVVLSVAMRSSPSSTGWTLGGVRWMGRVLGVEVGDEAARIRCEPAQVSLKRIGLRRLYSRACSHVLYSAACGATPISAAAEVIRCEGRQVELAGLLPAVAGRLAGGWLQTPSGARHMIVSVSAPQVELLYPANVQPGDPVLLVAGCDHSLQTCQSRFNNLDNYGGFPFIPIKNPFSTGVF
jgi:hypothetical protein